MGCCEREPTRVFLAAPRSTARRFHPKMEHRQNFLRKCLLSSYVAKNNKRAPGPGSRPNPDPDSPRLLLQNGLNLMQQSILKRVHDSEMHRSGSTKRCIDGDILDEPITDAPSRYDLTTRSFYTFAYICVEDFNHSPVRMRSAGTI